MTTSRPRPGGWSLAETLLALALAAIVAVALLGLFTGGFARLAEQRAESTARMLAQRKLEEVSAAPRHALAPESGSFPSPHEGYGWEVRLQERAPGLQEVTVAVTGPAGADVELFTLLQTRPGRMVMTRIDRSNGDLWVVNADGSDPVRLTEHEALDTQGRLSPDGQHLAFVSHREGAPQIHLMDLASRKVRRLTRERLGASQPAWSPQGDRIAFVAKDPEGVDQVFVVGRGGGAASPVTFGEGPNLCPSFSPGGREIVFASRRGGNYDLYVTGAGGGTGRRVTDSPAIDTSPAWSPRGDRIAFVSNRDGNYEIYTVAPDGSDVRRITQAPESAEMEPCWAPDGHRILFVSDWLERRNPCPFTINPDGTALTPVGRDLVMCRFPCWGL